MTSDYVPSCFLSFPNELIRSVFDYLSPTDLLESFGYLSNKRLESVIAVHIFSMRLNVGDASSFDWLKQNLSVVRQHVKHISINIELVEELLEIMPVIDALTISYGEDTQYLIDLFVAQYQMIKEVHIGALTLMTFDGIIGLKTAELLLGGNGQLPEHTLIIDSCLLQIDRHRLPSSQLRHVDFIITEEKIFHILCAHLPNLETVKVGIMSSGLQTDTNFFLSAEPIGISLEISDEDYANQIIMHLTHKAEDNSNDITIVAPVHLRSVVINGHIPTFSRLSRLFELSSASLRTIKINVWAYSIIDPEQINNIAPHIDFRFNINYEMINIPADFDWQKYVNKLTRRPVLRCDNTTFCNLSFVIDRSVFWLKITKMLVTSPQSLCFSKVHTLKFQYCHVTMNTETVKFIQQTFPQLHTLVWRLSSPKISTKILLSMINTLVVHSQDRTALASLFTLCPNVTHVHFTKAFEQAENLPELKDACIQNTCKQITLVKLVPNDKMNEQEIIKLFPNANITYDAIPFYERMF